VEANEPKIMLAGDADSDLYDITSVPVTRAAGRQEMEKSAAAVARLIANTPVAYTEAFVKAWRKLKAELVVETRERESISDITIFAFCRRTALTPDDCSECKARFACWSTK